MNSINLQYAKKLCSASEFQLVKLSYNPGDETNSKKLKNAISLSRRLRDKYRDIARRQKLEIRGKNAQRRSRPVTSNKRTEEKARLFSETLQRFTALGKSSRAQGQRKKVLSKKQNGKGSSKFLKTKKGRLSQKKNNLRAKDSNKKSLAGRKSSAILRSNAKAIQGHIRAKTGRKQGKRDSRQQR